LDGIERVSTDGQAGWVEVLYDQRAAGLLLYGRALGLSHGEAEDMLHETFRSLLALEDSPAQPVHYLVRSFRNRVLNHRRGGGRRLAREMEAHRWFEPAAPDDPREERLAQALAGLPPEQREVIVLKIWQRLTFAAIGAALGLSPHTVAGRYRYGLERLRRALDEAGAELDGMSHALPEITGQATAFVTTASSVSRG
jgi:RNA polymerase sigma-70 factor, ECF subfamily